MVSDVVHARFEIVNTQNNPLNCYIQICFCSRRCLIQRSILMQQQRAQFRKEFWLPSENLLPSISCKLIRTMTQKISIFFTYTTETIDEKRSSRVKFLLHLHTCFDCFWWTKPLKNLRITSFQVIRANTVGHSIHLSRWLLFTEASSAVSVDILQYLKKSENFGDIKVSDLVSHWFHIWILNFEFALIPQFCTGHGYQLDNPCKNYFINCWHMDVPC